MRIVSTLENQSIEKRIAITPEIAKKYIALGFEIFLIENYGQHLGFKDSDFKELGVNISNDESEILKNADIIIQLGLLSDENLSNLKEKQTLVGVFNPYNNKEKIESLSKKNIMKIKSSLKSLKKRDLNSKLVRRRGRVYIINKTNPKFKARQK